MSEKLSPEHKYSFIISWSDEDESFIATCPEFIGLSAFGDTHEEALKEVKVALSLMVEVVEEDGEPLPEPKFVDAKSVRSAEAAAIEQCIKIAEGERLTGDTGEEADRAYNTAIEHVVAAIRRGGNHDLGLYD